MIRRPPRSTLFPYPPLSRSRLDRRRAAVPAASRRRCPPHRQIDPDPGAALGVPPRRGPDEALGDRKSTRLNSSHGYISYAVFCLKKKKKNKITLVLHQVE